MTPRFPRPSVSRPLLALAVAVALAGAGCAAHSGSPGHVVVSSPTSTTSGTSTTNPTGSPDPTASAPSGPTLTLDGVARHGVEPGCTVLAATDHKLYLLLGAGGRTPDQTAVPLGVPVRVRAVRVDQLVSYCQQGTPVEIVDITRR